MPTNEERREVAYNLRGNAQAHPDMSLILNVAFSDKGLKPDDGSMEYTVTSREAAMRLSDLIEPEPERTCKNIGAVTDFKCSLCGYEYKDDDGFAKNEDVPADFSYCPCCGAKVVDE